MGVAKTTFLVALLLAFNIALFGQTATGGVNGTIADPSGAVIQDATVKLTNLDTQIAAQVPTSAAGYFVFVNVRPGNYTLTVSKTGFKTTQSAAFKVGVNETITQSMALDLGNTTQVVEVAGSAPIVQSSSSELGTVIEQKEVQELPLNGRNFTQLLSLTPGATPVNTAQGGSVTSQDAGPSGIPNTPVIKPSMNGQQNRSMLFYQDGSLNTDMRGPIYGVLPLIEAVQEFKVQSHNDKAEFGGVTGGIVNLVSKSGTNSYHGSGYEFVRNDAFDARSMTDVNPDGTKRAPGAYRQNQFGATFGGPIQKNKTFFFLAYDGWRYSKASSSTVMIPTPDEISGDFTNTPSKKQIYNPYTTRQVGGLWTRDPFKCDASGNALPVDASGYQVAGTPCYKIPAGLISPGMQAFLRAYLPTPNYTAASYNFIDTRPVTDSANNWQVKVDHTFGTSDNVFARFSGMLVDHQDIQAGTLETYPSRYHAFNPVIGWTHSFGNSLFTDVRFGFLQKPYVFNQADGSVPLQKLAEMGFAGYEAFDGMTFTLASPWFTTNIGNRGDSPRSNPSWNLSANLNWIKGNHNLKTGYEVINVTRGQANTFETAGFTTAMTSSVTGAGGNGSDGLSLASAMLGLPASASGEMPVQGLVHFAFNTWALYLQDEWKLRPHLTLNIGLRADIEMQPNVLNNRLSNGLDLKNQQWLLGAGVGDIPNCKDINVNPCFTGTNNGGFNTVDHYQNIKFMGKSNFMYGTGHDLGPRFGFAWEGPKKFVVRGGYSIFYDTVTARSQYMQNDLEAAQWPWVRGFAASPNNKTGSPLTLINNVMGAMAGQTTASPWTGLQSVYFDDPNYKPARSQQWHLEIQRELGKGSMLSVAYVGSKNSRTEYTGYANASPTASAAVNNATRPIPWMDANIRYTTSDGWSNYNGFQARYQRRLSKSLLTLVSYTWSKSLDTQSGYFNAENGAGASPVQNYWDKRNAYGVSGYDIPHFMSWYTVYDVPAGKGKRWLQSGPLSWVLGNWQWNYIFQIRSGQPFNLNVGGDPAHIAGTQGTFNSYSRPNVIADPFAAGPVAANPDQHCQYTVSEVIPSGTYAGQKGWAADQTRTAASYYNQCAFTTPINDFGNFGRGVLRSPHVVNMDTSLFKTVPINERFSMQLRFEGFNVFNFQNLSTPGTTIGNANAGVVTNTTGPLSRQLQFGMRLLF
jgi:hypothetical protein